MAENDSYKLKHEKAVRDEKFKQLELDKQQTAEKEKQIEKSKQKLGIDQKIATVAAELKKLNEMDGTLDEKAIARTKEKLAELKKSKKVYDSINEAQVENLEIVYLA